MKQTEILRAQMEDAAEKLDQEEVQQIEWMKLEEPLSAVKINVDEKWKLCIGNSIISHEEFDTKEDMESYVGTKSLKFLTEYILGLIALTKQLN